ncbi:MAG: metallophosphoesterase [Acetobacteraceae bacterium]|nr:metallophosphoesterase [Acetobacteraceae bacterium]
MTANRAEPPRDGAGEVLAWLHIGDLHLTTAESENRLDLDRIVALANALPPGSLDFAVLPGDNAEDGTADQYALLHDAVAGLRLKLHVLPGDHDMKPGSLDAFHATPGTERLPRAVQVKSCRCLFLDVVSAGSGGPDFRLGEAQLAWAERELEAAEADREGVVVFMHTYPADLREGAERLGALLAYPQVLCVDMGHTHYNELSNDGGTIYMATRSTGQIEEGPPGFSIAAVDGRTVSWRFKPLDQAWPFVLIRQPADRRLVTGASQIAGAPFVARAKVLSDAAVESVDVQVRGGEWAAMAPVSGEVALWEAHGLALGPVVRVRATDAQGRQDEDQVELAHLGWTAPERATDGSDRDRVGAWPEKGILGTQLGPNRNGKQW